MQYRYALASGCPIADASITTCPRSEDANIPSAMPGRGSENLLASNG
jgi:hypothetical protein